MHVSASQVMRDLVMSAVLAGGPSPCEAHPLARHAHVVAFRGEILLTAGRVLARWPRPDAPDAAPTAETVLVIVSDLRVLLYGKRHDVVTCRSYWWEVDAGGASWEGPGGACLHYRLERPQTPLGRRARAMHVVVPRRIVRTDGSIHRDALRLEWLEGVDAAGRLRRRAGPLLAGMLQRAHDRHEPVSVERLARLLPRPAGTPCAGCGQELDPDWLVCPRCGTSVAAAPAEPAPVTVDTQPFPWATVSGLRSGDDAAAGGAPPRVG